MGKFNSSGYGTSARVRLKAPLSNAFYDAAPLFLSRAASDA